MFLNCLRSIRRTSRRTNLNSKSHLSAVCSPEIYCSAEKQKREISFIYFPSLVYLCSSTSLEIIGRNQQKAHVTITKLSQSFYNKILYFILKNTYVKRICEKLKYVGFIKGRRKQLEMSKSLVNFLYCKITLFLEDTEETGSWISHNGRHKSSRDR
jgi:hypothetical protein